jgi:hypothetical protein
MLRERSAPHDDLLFFYDAISDPIMVRQDHALRSLDVLLEPFSTIWITLPPNDWLVEVDHHTIRLAMPPPVSPQEAALADARRSALLAPLTAALDEAGISYRTFLVADLAAPQPDAAIAARGIDWQRLEITFRACVPRGDTTALAEELVRLLNDRGDDDEASLAVQLLHDEAPLVTMSARDFVSVVDHAMMAADRWDDQAPGGELWLSGLRLYPVTGKWLAEIYVERANWRIRVAGQQTA